MSTRPAMLHFYLATWLVFISAAALADNFPHDFSHASQPAIALIIDDLGNQAEQGGLVVLLPGRVACAFLPYAPFTSTLARKAHLLNVARLIEPQNRRNVSWQASLSR